MATPGGKGLFPRFAYHGGPVIDTPQVSALFVGDWSSPAQQSRAERLGQFVRDLLNSRYMNILSQYGCGTSGSLVGSAFVAAPDNDLSAGEIRNLIQAAIDAALVPEPGDASAYLLFLADGMAVDDESAGAVMCEATSDTAFGYHDFFATAAGSICYFAVVPSLTDGCLRSSCPDDDAGCTLHLAQTQEQRQTQVASHELSEMFSNPQVGAKEAWSNPGSPHENGDICNGQMGTITVGPNTWTVQLMYSKWHDLNTDGETTCLAEWPEPIASMLPAGP
jgi:hypothetical protein